MTHAGLTVTLCRLPTNSTDEVRSFTTKPPHALREGKLPVGRLSVRIVCNRGLERISCGETWPSAPIRFGFVAAAFRRPWIVFLTCNLEPME